jgi:hypothetical protein
MEWGNIYDFLVTLLGKIAEVGQYAYTWLTSDISIGTYTFKPLYISVALLFVLLGFWLKNKIMGDIG